MQMGYPMTYRRVINRNNLLEGYESTRPNRLIAGDLRRLEADTRDEGHLNLYAQIAGTTPDIVKKIFDEFFECSRWKFTPKGIELFLRRNENEKA